MSIDPVAFSIGPLKIHWYAISYIAAILVGSYYANSLLRLRKSSISKQTFDRLMNYIVCGIILGGRLGHVLFFDIGYYLSHPIEVFCIWHGGMSFHGGCLGVFSAIYIFSRRNKLDFWEIVDVISCAAPIGLFLGRVANFINQELYGTPTDSCFGVIFPDVDALPRHPTQVYEALTEGLLLFLIMNKLYRSKKLNRRLGGVFAIMYSVPRFVIEYFKEPDTAINFYMLNLLHISIGQLISCIFILLGVVIILKVEGKKC